MKCEGAANPPCARCRKVGRECLLFPRQNPPAYSSLPAPNREGHLRAVAITPNWPSHPLLHTPASSVSVNPQPMSSSDSENTQPIASSDNGSARNINVQEVLPEPHMQTLGVDFVTLRTAGATTFSSQQGDAVSDLPSVYGIPATDAINDPTNHNVGLEQNQTATRTKRKTLAGQSQSQETPWSLSDSAIPQQSDEGLKLPMQDLRDMILM